MGMLFQPDVTPQGLSQLGNVPLDMTIEAHQAYQRAQQADQMSLADMPGALAHQQAMRPLLEQQQQVSNDQGLAQLPGMRAQSSILQRQDQTQAATHDAVIQDMLGKFGHEKTQRYLDEVSDLGPLMQQAATQVAMGPGGAARAKGMFAKAGREDQWNDAWDKLSPVALSEVLNNTGKQYSAVTQKFQQATAVAAQKAQSLAAMEELKQQGRMQLRNSINSTLVDLKQREIDAKVRLDKPSMEAIAGRYTVLADALRRNGDPADEGKIAELDAAAERAAATAKNIKVGPAEEGNKNKIDPSAIDESLKTINPARTPTGQPTMPPRAGAAPKGQPTTPQEAAGAGWTLHADKNGNQAYVSPDGKNFIEVK